jgi:hypothetical protein
MWNDVHEAGQCYNPEYHDLEDLNLSVLWIKSVMFSHACFGRGEINIIYPFFLD